MKTVGLLRGHRELRKIVLDLACVNQETRIDQDNSDAFGVRRHEGLSIAPIRMFLNPNNSPFV